MKNMKLGSKIGAAFGLVILITMALGAFGIFNMFTVGHDADRLAKQYLPQVKVANELERHSLLAMYAIRGYGYSLDSALLKKGNQEVALAEKALSHILALANQYPSLAKLSSRHDQALEAINQYKKMIKQTESRDRAIQAGRELLEAAASQFMEACQDLLNHQNQRYEQELLAKAPQDKLKERFQKVLLIHHIIDLGNLARLATFKAQALRDLKDIKQALAAFPLIEKDLAKLASFSSDQEDYQARATISASTRSYRDAIDVLLINWTELQKLNHQRNDIASRVLAAASSTALEGLNYAQKKADQASQNLEIATIAVLIGLLAALVIAIILSVFTTRSVIKPIKATAKAMGLVSQGDFRIKINKKHLERGDELGSMLRDVQKMAEDLSSTVLEVAQAANLVAGSANEISIGNQDISERTQNQASAVEETASAIEQITASVRQNAENSRQANDLARSTAEMARQGGRVVDSTVEAMAALTESSQKISDITTVVNEIAFQTNLLALNAAVEAARAGEAGRGFAVVAGEVRNLAGRSASAAKEIQGLIADSAHKVEQGNLLVGQSGRLLGEIIENVQAVADTVAEITASSQEQALGISEVNKAVAQMDEAVQQNAVVVEEAASSSEQMAAAAEELNSQMDQFKINRGQTAARDGSPRPHRQPEPTPAPRTPPQPAHQPALAPPKTAKAKDANFKKPVEDEFFKVDDLDGFEEF